VSSILLFRFNPYSVFLPNNYNTTVNTMTLKPAILILMTIALNACGEKKASVTVASKAGPPPALKVDALIASPQSISSDIELPGTILAFESTEIHPEIAGRLVQLNVREGTVVSRGALLAKLFDGDLRAQMNKLEVQLKIADQTEKRSAELLRIQGISQQEYDLSLLEVYNIKADMEIIQQSIRKTEIRAPFSGRVGLKNVSPGAYVSPATIITTISQVNKLKIQFNVPEKYGPDLKNGMPVAFTIDGSAKVYTANIIAKEVQVEENTRSLAVRAEIKNQDADLIPGAFAKVKIVLGKNENAILIPNNAVVPIGRTKQIYLYKGGKATAVEVTTGIRDSTNIQIIEGLKTGDTVITSAILFLRPGSVVEIGKIREPGADTLKSQ
ncbi:MAG: efflux RND transporter periplasmic adaptor subunit, partial [Saprospiraceae bacterium]